VKPVVLYSSEVWGMFNMTSKLKKSKNDLIYDLYNEYKIEKLNLNYARVFLGWVAAFNIAMSVLDEGYSRTYY
jgi:hypothetical protein